MTGFKTLIFNLLLAMLGILELADWTSILGEENKAAIAMLVVSVIGVVLRSLTKTPIGVTK